MEVLLLYSKQIIQQHNLRIHFVQDSIHYGEVLYFHKRTRGCRIIQLIPRKQHVSTIETML